VRTVGHNWKFVTTHTLVLIELVQDNTVSARDLAQRLAISERTAQSVLKDLVDGGYITRTKLGRCNRYAVNVDAPLRHETLRDLRIADLVSFLTSVSDGAAPGTPRPARNNRRLHPSR
jgi:predicted ArsR family transcriptional regulator